MISFFRKIRKSLLRETAYKKYILYALGEISLVVIGILIALQINNLNQAKQDRNKELKILQSLLEDCTKNQQNLEIALKRYETRNHIIEKSVNFIGIKDEEVTDIVKRYLSSTGINPTEITDGTLNSIISSDKLELITNDSLKKFLTSYPADIQALKSRKEMLNG